MPKCSNCGSKMEEYIDEYIKPNVRHVIDRDGVILKEYFKDIIKRRPGLKCSSCGLFITDPVVIESLKSENTLLSERIEKIEKALNL